MWPTSWWSSMRSIFIDWYAFGPWIPAFAGMTWVRRRFSRWRRSARYHSMMIGSPWRKWVRACSSISTPRPGLSGTVTWLSVCRNTGSVSAYRIGCGVWSNSVTGSLT